MTESVFNSEKSGWRVAHADRVAFLVDGADYFSALREACKNARQSVYIISWDIDSRIPLVYDRPDDDLPVELGPFLNALVERNASLQVRVLNWDFAALYTFDRELLPAYKLGWQTHPRLCFRSDARHPVGASHHQKFVVIDDTIAFCGGLDLTRGRWDTSIHDPDDERRVDVEGRYWRPYHDVQMLVAGPAASQLGELARQRWQGATGESLSGPAEPSPLGNIWPGQVRPDVDNCEIAIARTLPKYEDQLEVREVEQSYLDMIAEARRLIYIENQYFTADSVTTALAERLAEDDAPEVVVVVPQRTEGWLAHNTMDVIRIDHFKRLEKADKRGRFKVYVPAGPGFDKNPLNVHAKVMIVDDRIARVGSANLNNRSMGLDSECDLLVDAGDNGRRRQAVAGFRARLLAEHLGCEQKLVESGLADDGSLIDLIEQRIGSPRCLKPLAMKVPDDAADIKPDPELVDPAEPVDPDKLLKRTIPKESETSFIRRAIVPLIVVGIMATLALVWRYTPLEQWLDVDRISTEIRAIQHSAVAPLVLLGVYLVGAALVFPFSILIVATVVVFGPITGFIYAWAGGIISGLATFWLGKALGHGTLRRFAGDRINTVSRRLGEQGLLTIIAIRIIPVAPFTLINMVAGASHIKTRDFVFGTAIGLVPGIIGLSIIVDRILAVWREPGVGSVAGLAVVAIIIVVAGYYFSKWVLRRSRET